MDNCFLIGNGLNRTLQHSIAWGDLLKEIAEKNGVDYCSDISMPLEFERITNCYLRNSDTPSVKVYADFKKQIANKIQLTKLPENAIHHKIKTVKPDAIMTTNYDNLLEYVYSPNYNHKGNQQKYLFDPTSIQQKVQFYHLHGMASVPQSICLGYEHYAGIIEKLRGQINKKENNENTRMLIRQVLLGERPRLNTWGERFYTSNIAILGLGLSSCEIDLWWLITHRAYLYFSDYYGLKQYIRNQISYFDIIDDIVKENTEKEARRQHNQKEKESIHHLLENSHINVQKYKLSKYYGDYQEAYSRIISDISIMFDSPSQVGGSKEWN